MQLACAAGICLVVLVAGAVAATQDYDSACHKDKGKSEKMKDNYVDCTTEEHVKDGSTGCCDVDGVINCCNKDASWMTMILIAVGIGTTTIVLALCCFWIFWCDERACPCIGPYKRRWDEKTEWITRRVCCLCRNDEEDDDDDLNEKTYPPNQVSVSITGNEKAALASHEHRPATTSTTESRSATATQREDVIDAEPQVAAFNDTDAQHDNEVKDDFFF